MGEGKSGMKKIDLITATMLTIAVLLCAGCRVETSQGANGGENVKVETPLGGVKVKADNSTTATDLGMKVYPGAVVMKKYGHGDHDSGSADVSVGFGSFKMSVKVVSYGTNDSLDQVLEFYRKALGSDGDVIECRDEETVGKPESTSEGLTCRSGGAKKNLSGMKMDMNLDEGLTLKAGSPHHQRIVAIDHDGSDGKKTKFVLVELELPNSIDDLNDSN
jgi:hypothetical protein